MRFVHAMRRPWALVSALALLLLAFAGMQAAPLQTTRAEFRDATAAQMKVESTRYGTNICVIWSNEDRPDAVFTMARPDQISDRGWTTVVDARSATTVKQLNDLGCSVVMIAGEAWGVQPASRTLALAWFNQQNGGGSVLSTGNDTGVSTYPLPELIGQIGTAFANYPFGGSIPASAAVRGSVVPAFPTWTPGAAGTYELDNSSRPVTAVASGATCVGTVVGHPTWCAAIAKTNSQGGRWVHLHTKIGSPELAGDAPGADAALAWLAIGRD